MFKYREGLHMEIQIVSGFLGAGKTTFLNKYLPLLQGRTAVVENEFGEVGLDGELIREDVPVKELSDGCICCSLAINLKEGIVEIAEKYAPDRILIEPSGIGKLSDVISACEKASGEITVEITNKITIVDACDCAIYAEEFGQFYSDQIANANTIFLSNAQAATEEEKQESLACIKALNSKAVIYEEDWRDLDGDTLLAILAAGIEKKYQEGGSASEMPDSEPEIEMSLANRCFSNVVLEDSCAMAEEDIQYLLEHLNDERYGQVLRAKGIVPAIGGGAWHFDYTHSIQKYEKADGGIEEVNRVIVIGCNLNKKEIRKFVYSLGEE